MKVAPFGNMRRLFHSCRRQRAFGNPPLATTWPSPAPLGSVSLDSQSSIDSLRIQFPCHRKRWGAREYINAHHPRLASGGGQVNVVAGAFFSSILPSTACQGKGDHASLNLACPIYGEGDHVSGGRGSRHRRRAGSDSTYRKKFYVQVVKRGGLCNINV